MKLITLPRLRNAQLQNLAERILEICQPITPIQEAVDNVTELLKQFVEGMLKDQVSTVDKAEIDTRRDRFLTGFENAVYAEQFMPFESETEKNTRFTLLQRCERVKHLCNSCELTNTSIESLVDTISAIILRIINKYIYCTHILIKSLLNTVIKFKNV